MATTSSPLSGDVKLATGVPGKEHVRRHLRQGTESLYKIYAESFRGPEHLRRIQDEARAIVAAAFESSASASPAAR